MPKTQVQRRKFTPPEVATMWGTGADKVTALIRSGQLRAINIASRGCVRPRYLVDQDDIEAFERSRQVVPASKGVGRVRRKAAPGVTEFF